MFTKLGGLSTFFIVPKLYNIPVKVLYVSMHLHRKAPKVLNSFKRQFNLSESLKKCGTFKLILKSSRFALVHKRASSFAMKIPFSLIK